MYFHHEPIETRFVNRPSLKSKNDAKFHLVQDIRVHQEPVWVLKFSPCGHWLATGGKDGVMKVWRVVINPTGEDTSSNEKEDKEEEKESKTKDQQIARFYHLIEHVPYRQYCEHEYDVVDLSWQLRRDDREVIIKSKLIVTCGLDMKIIVWNLDKETPKMIFDQALQAAPTCVSFHPRIESQFLTGSLDSTLRRWSIE